MNHEDFEQLEQDAARFRWCLANPEQARWAFRGAAGARARDNIDQLRLPMPNRLLDAPGGRYDGHMDGK